MVATEVTLEVVVICVFCDAPLDHHEDLWCPECEDDEPEVEVPAAVPEARLAA